MDSLPKACKHADDVLVYDDTQDGKGHRLVARFIAGELVKTAHPPPEWLQSVIGREQRNPRAIASVLHDLLFRSSKIKKS